MAERLSRYSNEILPLFIELHCLCEIGLRNYRVQEDLRKAIVVPDILLIEDQQADFVLADKGYDSQAIVDAIRSKGAEPVIPPRSLRKMPRDYDHHIYKERNAIERMFNKIKQFRRIATRYDKLAITYLSFLHVAAIAVWLR